jgi:hypothetical protein
VHQVREPPAAFRIIGHSANSKVTAPARRGKPDTDTLPYLIGMIQLVCMQLILLHTACHLHSVALLGVTAAS